MAKKLWSTKAHETPEFVEFWKTWLPRARDTDGRGLARDTFLEHVQNGADAQDMVDGAKWLIRNFKDFQYLPLSSTWLNRKAYEDYAEHYRAYEARRQERQRSQEQSTNVVSIDAERRADMAERMKAVAAAMRVKEVG
jgi:hypothetical protein